MKKIKLYFLRSYFPYNLGDTVMLSALFKAVKKVFEPCYVEVVSDDVVAEAFHNDPFVDRFRLPYWHERVLPKKFYKTEPVKSARDVKRDRRFVIWPEWRKETFAFLSRGNNLEECINAPYKNILSCNYALQVCEDVLKFDDLRPRIYLTEEEKAYGRRMVVPNSIAINAARIRNSQKRTDSDRLRYRLSYWKDFAAGVRKYDPTIKIYEVGQEQPEGIGDEFIPNTTIRKAAAVLDAVRLVVLSDGGVHNICNAIDKKVLLFQGYEWNPPELFKMGNAIFSDKYHPECRKRCHLFSDILHLESPKAGCSRECYELDPRRLAQDCIAYLEGLRSDR